MNTTRQGLLGLAPRRKSLGYSQAEFARILGIKRTRLTSWEIGYSWPSSEFLPEIARLLHCTIDDLYGPADIFSIPETEAEGHAG
jgi:transcriptional regulator with XRE-family HTH domain